MYQYCPRGHKNSFDSVGCAVCGCRMDATIIPKKRATAVYEEPDDTTSDDDTEYQEFLAFKRNKGRKVAKAASASNDDDDPDVEIPNINKLNVEITRDDRRGNKVNLQDAIRAAQPPGGDREAPPKVKPKQFLKEFLSKAAAIKPTATNHN